MTKEDYAIPKFERGFETIGWILTAFLSVAALWLPDAAGRPLQLRLFATIVALGALNLLFHRLLPASSAGPLAYRREDKALVISVGTVMLLTLYLYALPTAPTALCYLYLLPLIGATLVLEERVVLAEALMSIMAMAFLHAASHAEGAFWSAEFVVRAAVFCVAAGSLVAVTAGLRKAYAGAERLSVDLARRFEQVQVLGSLARQSELTPRLDQLATRAGEIIAAAVDSERHAIFVVGEARDEKLRQVGDAACLDRRDCEILTIDENARILQGVLETGTARILGAVASAQAGGDAHIRNMLVLPLRVRQAPIGVICLMNRRGDEGFRQEEVSYCEMLAGFTAGLLNGALLLQRTVEERRTVEQLSKLLVGRETKMRELKSRLRESSGL